MIDDKTIAELRILLTDCRKECRSFEKLAVYEAYRSAVMNALPGLLDEIERLHKGYIDNDIDYLAIETENHQCHRRIAELEAALRYYADPTRFDGGAMARAALNKKSTT